MLFFNLSFPDGNACERRQLIGLPQRAAFWDRNVIRIDILRQHDVGYMFSFGR
jgi:hypothetical protein